MSDSFTPPDAGSSPYCRYVLLQYYSTSYYSAPYKRQLMTHSSVPALDSAGCSCGCRVPSSGAVVIVMYSEFGADYKCPDSTLDYSLEGVVRSAPEIQVYFAAL